MKDRLSEIRERDYKGTDAYHAQDDIEYLLFVLACREQALSIAKETLKRVEERTRIMVWEDSCPATINSIAREALARIGEQECKSAR